MTKPPDSPTSFGRFMVKRLLGRGAMGSVYLALDPVIGREVAIKVLRMPLGMPPDEVVEVGARFEREFRSAGTLTHPNIVTVYDVGRERDQPFIAMEFAKGESLDSLQKAKRHFPLEAIVDMVSQLASALDYAHDRSIIHRDVKPANILLATDGQVKVTDFGVAKLTSSTMTRTGMILGTPAYMAPEQVAGRTVTGSADQFALGVILYELLTGERPFASESATSILYKIVHEVPLPPRELNRNLPPPVDQVVLKVLSKNPAERYASCVEFARAVKKALAAGPAEAGTNLEPAPGAEKTVLLSAGDADAAMFKGASEALLRRREQHRNRGLRGLIAGGLFATAALVGWVIVRTGGSSSSEPTQQPTSVKPAELKTSLAIVGNGESIWLDGAATGLEAPATIELSGPEGTRRVLELRRGPSTVVHRAFIMEPNMPTGWNPTLPPTGPMRRTFTVGSTPPGATVVVDGRRLPSPTPTEISLDPGEELELKLELEGHTPSIQQLRLETLSADVLSSGRISVPLVPKVPLGTLFVAAPYPVRVRVNGREFGPGKELRIPAARGRRSITVVAPEIFLRQEFEVYVESNEESRVPVPEVVLVSITAVPGNCRVSIDGRDVDVTPVRDLPVAAGAHEFTFVWPGLGKQVTQTEIISLRNRQLTARPPN